MFLCGTPGKEREMTASSKAYDFLKELQKRNGKQTQSFDNLSEYLLLKAKEKGIPLSGQFELTPLCNFSCKMCYVHLKEDQLQGQSVLPVSTWKDLMRQAWETGMIQATLTGGECLAYPGFEELFLYLHSLGCEVNILTNGFLLDDKRIRFFQEHKPAVIQITLYGWNDDVYERVTGQRAFGQVTENIRKAIKAGLSIKLNVTPNNYLGEDALETVREARALCKRVMVNSCIFPPREETGRNEQLDNPDIQLYLRIYRKMNEMYGIETRTIDMEELPPAGGPSHECKEKGLRCGGGRSCFGINWKGELVPCNRMEMIKAYPLTEGFKKAWEKVNRGANEWPRVPECTGCAYDSICNNCAANMLQYAKPGERPAELCEQARMFVQHGIWRITECE